MCFGLALFGCAETNKSHVTNSSSAAQRFNDGASQDDGDALGGESELSWPAVGAEDDGGGRREQQIVQDEYTAFIRLTN